MPKWMTMSVVLVVSLAGVVQAQTMIDWKTGALQWNWNKGDGADAELFEVGCGEFSGTYTTFSRGPDQEHRFASEPMAPTPLKFAPWVHYCAVRAVNTTLNQVSDWSNEVIFVLTGGERLLPPPSNLRVVLHP